jgi:hypothetical protein
MELAEKWDASREDKEPSAFKAEDVASFSTTQKSKSTRQGEGITFGEKAYTKASQSCSSTNWSHTLRSPLDTLKSSIASTESTRRTMQKSSSDSIK